LAGFETVRTILWTLICIASEPEIEKRIHDELINVFGDDQENEWTFDLDKLNQLNYLDCCIREGLRLFSPLIIFGRNTGVDSFQLDEVNCLPPSTEYLVSVYSVHRNEKVYPQPEKFNPDRWSSENIQSIPTNCYLPFGIGPRTCIGYRLALIEMKIVITLIVKQFRLQVNQHYSSIDWIFPLTLKPVKPCTFKLSSRF
ncbi:cytochrome P450 4c3-like, partial [Panonychus citri]|uniref:cytochrome P450 4c3-like n=1 Tax=Panonychus citri TaxID=50023 RepID=UPI002307E81B